MLHRALFGSLERFTGVFMEHCAGHLPFWLAPVQVMILPVTNEQDDYAKQVVHKLQVAGVRAEMDLRNEKVNYKIREHSLKKIPVIAVVGKKEVADETLTLRFLGSDKQEVVPLAEAVKRFKLDARYPGIEYED